MGIYVVLALVLIIVYVLDRIVLALLMSRDSAWLNVKSSTAGPENTWKEYKKRRIVAILCCVLPPIVYFPVGVMVDMFGVEKLQAISHATFLIIWAGCSRWTNAWFVRWPCPRCHCPIHDGGWHGIGLIRKCEHCGLRIGEDIDVSMTS